MSTDDRTPDIREVRSMYGAGSNLFRETPEQHYLGHPAPDYGAEFDRFLARVKRDAAREALDGYAKWEEKRFHHLHVNGESAEASKCAYAALTARAYLHLRYHEESP